MSSLSDILTSRIQASMPRSVWSSPSLLVAVSGGSDSVALLRLLAEICSRNATPQVSVFHFDHQWSVHSETTAHWVQNLATQLGLPCFTRNSPQADTPRTGNNRESEANARRRRLVALEQVAAEHSFHHVLTGHTRDDQAETVLMRIARGTGIAGLSGVPQRRSLNSSLEIWRPLLTTKRQELRDYLKEISQDYLEDPSNSDPHWTRNRLRTNLLPALRTQVSPRIDESLCSLADHATDYRAVIQFLAAPLASAVQVAEPARLEIDLKPLAQLPEPILRALLVHWWTEAGLPQAEMTSDHWKSLSRVAYRPEPSASGQPSSWPACVHLPPALQASRSKGRLTIQPIVGHKRPTETLRTD